MFKKLAAPILVPFLVVSLAALFGEGCGGGGGGTTGTGGHGTGGAKGTGGMGSGGHIGTGGTIGTGGSMGTGGTDAGTPDAPKGTGGSTDSGMDTAGDAGDGAATMTFNIQLDPMQAGTNVSVDGGPTSTGHGTAMVVLTPSTGAVTVNGTFTGLTGPATFAHIHGPAAAGSTAGVILGPFNLVNAPADGGDGGGSGNGTFSFTGTLSTAPIDGGNSLVQDMIAGLTYVNVHTTDFPAGEIRGQVH